MTGQGAGDWTRTSRVIRAASEEIYRAFTDSAALVVWLPPGDMTGKIYEFDARVGGGYRMSLFYPPGEHAFRGKTSEREDMVTVRFVELTPPRRIIETVRLYTADPALLGEIMLIVAFEGAPGGTRVSLTFSNLPPGLRPEDNEAGARLSWQQLARRFE